MVKRMDRQHSGQKKKGQTTQWSKEKDRQHSGQKKRTDNTVVERKKNKL